MHVSEDGLALIESFEGFSSRPYFDRFGGVWTRGFGETEGITASSPAISRAQGQANLRRLIATRYEWAIEQLHVELNQHQFDALCSFVWNLGTGIFTGRLRAALQGRRWREVGGLMLAYDHAGGVVLAGLVRRRQAEAALFLRPMAGYVPADEQRWRGEYDALAGRSGPWAAMRRRVLRRVMTARRKLIWRLAQRGGWSTLNRAARYRALLVRTE